MLKINEFFILIVIQFILKGVLINANSIQNLLANNESDIDYDYDKWFWNKEEYPNPYELPPYCRRTKPSYICDPDHLISKRQANIIDNLINDIKNGSICFCSYCPPNERGLTISVALTRNIYKEYNVRQLQNAETFAEYIRKKWNFGICDNNIVILVIADDNQIVYSEGTTTSKVFPKFLLDDTIKNSEIHFIQENYYKGLENIVKSLKGILNGNIQYSAVLEDNNNEEFEESFEETKETNDESVDDSSHVGVIVGAVVGLLVFIAIVVFILIYLRRRFNEDGTKFQFKGMLSKGYWLNKNEGHRPVSVRPISTTGGVYEPCSIDDNCQHDMDVDKRLKEKLSEISDDEDQNDEELQVIEHNIQTKDTNTGVTATRHTVPIHTSASNDNNSAVNI